MFAILLGACEKQNDIEVVYPVDAVLLSYTKTPCFGFCYAFDFKLRADYQACFKDMSIDKNELEPNSLEGVNVSNRSSDFKNCYQVETDLWNKIVSKARVLKLHKMSKVYPDDGTIIADASHTIIKILIDGQMVEITDTGIAPDALDEFEAFVESLIEDIKNLKEI